MATDWFEQLTGSKEQSYEATKGNLEVDGSTLRSKVNHRTYVIGELETPTLGELRERAERIADQVAGTLKVASIAGHRHGSGCADRELWEAKRGAPALGTRVRLAGN